MKKIKDLLIVALIYIVAYTIGYLACKNISSVMFRYFIFDVVATIVTFAFSTVMVNSSVYDAYWSLTPMVMIVWLFGEFRAFSAMQILFLIVFCLWSVRLTLNWITVFTDFSYEDWRYRKYRDETSRYIWPIVNFWGIHMVPTLVVFGGMLPLFVVVKERIGILSLPGVLIMLAGILLEYFADTNMHAFLNENKDKSVCRRGLWKYSRHPNYLGEISFWLGVYIFMIPYGKAYWYYAIGFISIMLLFNIVSIPLMEKRQLARRADYEAYCKETSRLILLPNKKTFTFED